MNLSSNPKVQRRLSAVEADAPSRLGLFKKLYAGKASPRQCIKAFCLECCGMDTTMIKTCTAMACPLWQERPFQTSSEDTPEPVGTVSSGS